MAKVKKADMNRVLMNGAKAAAGGIAAELLADFIAQNSPEMIEKNPKLTEFIPIAAGMAGLLLMNKPELEPVFYGMIGAGASGFADDIMSGMQGFQRVNYMNGLDADELGKGIAFIEKMQGIGFDPQPDEYNDGMSDAA